MNKSLNTFLTLPPPLLISPHLAAKPLYPGMTDLIYLAVVVLFFAASGRYSGWCEKL